MLSVSIVLIVFSLGLTFLFVFVYILYIAIKADHDEVKAGHIVALGKKLIENQPDKDYRLRLNRALTVASHRADVQIYILGGITGESSLSESRAGQRYLEESSIQARHIYIEEKSRDTLDNMKQLKSTTLISEKHIALITNRYHLARASIMAKGFGFEVERCAAEDSYSTGIIEIFRLFAETFFLHWYLSGRSFSRLTRNQRMLARIQ